MTMNKSRVLIISNSCIDAFRLACKPYGVTFTETDLSDDRTLVYFDFKPSIELAFNLGSAYTYAKLLIKKP